MNHRISFSGWVAILLLICVAAGTASASQASSDPDPRAAAAFADLVEAYRKRPALQVKTTLEIHIEEGEMTSTSEEVNAEFLFGSDRRGVLKINDFTAYLSNGNVTVVHDANDEAFYEEEDDDSPFYTLMLMFVELPFPHLAISIGEDDPQDVWMQLHPKAPMIVPTAVRQVEVDGKQMQEIRFESTSGSLTLHVDPARSLLEAAELTLTAGQFVQPGTTMRYSYSWEYELFEKALPNDRFEVDTSDRELAPMVAALEPERADPAEGGGPQPQQQAPPFVLATADGDAIDLEDLRGQVVVLDFWATWCRPCHAALAELHDVAEWANDEQLPVRIITINVFERTEDPQQHLDMVRDFWRQRGFTLPIAMDYSDQTAMEYGVTAIPATFVIRADGVIQARHSGAGPEYADQLKSDISEAIAAIDGL